MMTHPLSLSITGTYEDWCDEHGLPESQCRICNLELKIERQPRPVEES